MSKIFAALNLYLSKDNLARFALALSGLVLLIQFSQLSALLLQASDQKSIVIARDNDAGEAINVAAKTQLYNDNGWSAYGPTYYRAVRLLTHLSPLSIDLPSFSEEENRERELHFYLMFVSLISLYGFCFLISTLLFDIWSHRLLAVVVLVALLLQNEIWTTMIFRAHPDHLFSFVIAWATWATWKSYLEPKNQLRFISASSSWGIAASIKLTTLLFAPILIVFLLPWDKKSILSRLLKFLGYSFLAFCLIGFPQTPRLDGPILFLLRMRSTMEAANFASIQEWFHLFIDQLKFALPLLGLVLLFSWRREIHKAPLRKIFIFAAIIGGILAHLVSKKINIPHD
jgi:hypothetical protein